MQPVWRSVSTIGYRPVVDLFSGRVLAHEASLHEPAEFPDVPGDRDADVARAASRAIRMLDLARDLPTPVHIPLHPRALLVDAGLPDRLAEWCATTGRAPHTVTIQLAERYCVTDVVALRRRCASLRRLGFGIGIHDVGAFHGSLSVLAALRPQTVTVHGTVARALADSEEATAVVEAVVLFARRIGATLVVDGVDDNAAVAALRSVGVGYGQGTLFGDPEPGWQDVVAVPPLVATETPTETAAPASDRHTIRELLRRAMAASLDASGDEIRDIFAFDEDLLTIVLTDRRGRIAGAITRGKFMLAASGPFGHALHAKRGVAQHVSTPRVIAPDTPVSEAIRLVTSRSRSRVYDDLVVADETGRCVGIVRVADLLTAVQRDQVDVAISLDPLTELPSGRAVEDVVRRRLREPDGLSVSWIETARSAVIEADGFLAGNALVVEAAAVLGRLTGYLGGSWLGHLGAGCFVLLTERSTTERAIQSLLASRPEDGRGIEVDLSIGTLDCPPGLTTDPQVVSARLAELVRHAHQLGGTAWVSTTVDTNGHVVQYASKPTLSVGARVDSATSRLNEV